MIFSKFPEHGKANEGIHGNHDVPTQDPAGGKAPVNEFQVALAVAEVALNDGHHVAVLGDPYLDADEVAVFNVLAANFEMDGLGEPDLYQAAALLAKQNGE